jgi:hypothetical protein
MITKPLYLHPRVASTPSLNAPKLNLCVGDCSFYNDSRFDSDFNFDTDP